MALVNTTFSTTVINRLNTTPVAQVHGESGIGSGDAVWILTSAFIIFTMISGFGLVESGRERYTSPHKIRYELCKVFEWNKVEYHDKTCHLIIFSVWIQALRQNHRTTNAVNVPFDVA